MFEHFDRAAKLAVRFAAEEARRRDERRVGTEHLLLGLLVGAGPELERLTGVGIDEARAGLDAMDREALAAVGVDVDQLDLLWSPEESWRAAGRQRLPFTGGTRAALQGSLRWAAAGGSRVIRPCHVLLGLLDGTGPDPARALLARLDVDEQAVRRRIAEAA